MSLAALCRALRMRWRNFAEAVWPPSDEQRTREAVRRLGEELAWRQERLVALRRRIEHLCERLGRHERRLGASSPPSPPLQRAVERNRRRLARQEWAYRRECRRFARRKALRVALARGDMVVCGPGLAGGTGGDHTRVVR